MDLGIKLTEKLIDLLCCVQSQIFWVEVVSWTLISFVSPLRSDEGVVHPMQLDFLVFSHDISIIDWISRNDLHLDLLTWVHVFYFLLFSYQPINFVFCSEQLIVVNCRFCFLCSFMKQSFKALKVGCEYVVFLLTTFFFIFSQIAFETWNFRDIWFFILPFWYSTLIFGLFASYVEHLRMFIFLNIALLI